ncbi:DNA protecting protein DprA [Verrucomicrobium sp. GAS474]|uniref:DNA-processing protein DprA n=1 Tax=Verrucomicrobium sp. GAS474 TaxID=1882831 RepID=UPI00087B8F17|nr:DNA-processing protein DprA [Verrucomicrobium sp. GAS474]SDU21150.1 DNA protecting protein DprA [Verrucomicrobium sp. GAS474]
MTPLEATLTLSLLPHIGPVRARRLRERFGDAPAIFTATERDLQQVEGIGPESARSIRNGADGGAAAAEIEKAEALGVTLLHADDDRYPEALKEIYDPPLILYVRGTLPETWKQGVALVGSRVTSHYGLETAKKLGYQIAYAGVPVISGLARGIDTAAHMGALAAKGPTWAVLGTGVDHIYPAENASLAEKIAETGCLISEFPLGTKPEKQNFPMRNRIVSGLSFGVLVVEAGLGSGALITAKQALEQGRQVFAVPGRIDTPHSKGCHQLLKEGARLVEDVNDILGEMEFLFPPKEMTALGSSRPAPADLTPEEALLFETLGTEEVPIDTLIAKSGLPSGKVSSTLLRLEMKRLVRQLPGKLFVRTG